LNSTDLHTGGKSPTGRKQPPILRLHERVARRFLFEPILEFRGRVFNIHLCGVVMPRCVIPPTLLPEPKLLQMIIQMKILVAGDPKKRRYGEADMGGLPPAKTPSLRSHSGRDASSRVAVVDHLSVGHYLRKSSTK
jgi:hypothetical protein